MTGEGQMDKSISGRLEYAIILTSLTLVAEVAGGRSHDHRHPHGYGHDHHVHAH
jgi:hypothetical protein